MSKNKNALIRYKTLDKCFRNPGRMFFWEDLLEACNAALLESDPKNSGIQRRQLFDDIRFMESEQGWSIPLERKKYGRKVYYRYSDLSFSIQSQALNESELEQINSALQVLGRFTGTPQFEWVYELIPLLESKFGLKASNKEAISFESNVDLQGLHFITPIFNAITHQRVLEIEYQDFRSEKPYNMVFHPYYLKQYNMRWFAFGLNPETGIEHWNLALDRIIDVNESNELYINSDIDWSDYFFDIIGVTKPVDREPIEIELRFNSDIAPYIKTKPLHPTQKTESNDEGLKVRIEVIPNFELKRTILSFGDAVEVISPEHLRSSIKETAKGLSALYGN